MENPLDAPNGIAISRSLAYKFFKDENPLGKTIRLGGLLELTVTGVFSDIPENSHLQFDSFVNFKILESLGWETEIWNNSAFYTYLLLKPSADSDKIRAQIKHFLDDKPTLEEGTELDLQPLRDIHRTTV